MSRVDCQWGQWGRWESCTKTCGWGTQISRRRIQNHEQNGGRTCSGDTFKNRQCNTRSCPGMTYELIQQLPVINCRFCLRKIVRIRGLCDYPTIKFTNGLQRRGNKIWTTSKSKYVNSSLIPNEMTETFAIDLWSL